MTRTERDTKNEAILRIESKINEVFLNKLLSHLDDVKFGAYNTFCLHRNHDRNFEDEWEGNYTSSGDELLISWDGGYCEAYFAYPKNKKGKYYCLEFFNSKRQSMKKIFSNSSTPLYLFDKVWKTIMASSYYKSDYYTGKVDPFSWDEDEFLTVHKSCAKSTANPCFD